jgi:glycosyltransferase involved in cell wall biosynthesis
MEENPGISVIIPTFNSESFVAEAINSILMQEYQGTIEIIISDDGSTDKTLTIASNFDKVKILERPENCFTRGAAAARNRGLSACSQPFICFLDSDDFYCKSHFSKMTKILKENDSLGFVFCRVLECREENGKRMFRQWTHRKVNKNDIKNPVVSRSHIVHTNSFMFRKEVFENAGKFNESYSNGEDGDLWMRISEVYKGAFSDHFGAVYKTNHSEYQLTKNEEKEIRKSSLMIFNNAICRYKELKLKDRFRIFKLNHTRLIILYNNKKSIYYFKYILLILHYPISIWYILMDYYYYYQKRNLVFSNTDSCFLK